MPRRYRTSRRPRRSRRTSRRSSRRYGTSRRNRRTGRMSLYRSPMAPVRYCVHKYHDVVSIAAGVNLLSGNFKQFTSNGLYDPDISGVGHQPMFFDNMAAIYKRYQVMKAKITVTAINHKANVVSNTGATPTEKYEKNSYRLAVWNEGTGGSTTQFPSGMGSLIEEGNRNLKWRYVGPSLTGSLPSLTLWVTPHKLANRDLKDDTLQSAINSNPSWSTYWYVAAASADNNAAPDTIYLGINITYYVKWFNLDWVQSQN